MKEYVTASDVDIEELFVSFKTEDGDPDYFNKYRLVVNLDDLFAGIIAGLPDIGSWHQFTDGAAGFCNNEIEDMQLIIDYPTQKYDTEEKAIAAIAPWVESVNDEINTELTIIQELANNYCAETITE